MRLAIICLTPKGYWLAEKISTRIGGQIFTKGENFKNLTQFIKEIFEKFDGIIFICALGIVVRIIAPNIVNKLRDPAIIVIDECGKNVISLLSGHIGRANELTLEISKIIVANPVITTATDVNGKISADSFISKFGFSLIPKENIKFINSAILRGEDVFITTGQTRLSLISQDLIAGVGCKRGTQYSKILDALQSACEEIQQPLERVKLIASIDRKRDETGLLELAAFLRIEIKFFSTHQLQQKIKEYKLVESNFVKRTVGVGNVCEAAALCCVKKARFALPKKFFKNVTVALIWKLN